MFLHKSSVYGPVHSRRLGNSLGINLLSNDKKICNFECVYCECGWRDDTVQNSYPGVPAFREELEHKLTELSTYHTQLDHITFAGNGEPTLHREFGAIVDVTVALRDEYYPEAKISVLSNATMARNPKVFGALKKVDYRIMKLDAGTEETYQRIDQPVGRMTLDDVTGQLKLFRGDLYIQTLFLRGEYRGRVIDNTTDAEISAWIERLKDIQPAKVMVYGVDRETPASGLEKLEHDELSAIAEKVRTNGIEAECY